MQRAIFRSLNYVWFLTFLIWSTSVMGMSLTIGAVSDEPAKESRLHAPLVRYLAQRLASEGITKGEVLVAPSMKAMAEFLKSKRVDLYIDSPLSSIVVNRLANSKMVLRRWKKGAPEYHSVIFVKKESPIQQLSELSGKKIGFKDPYSSTGYILPRIVLAQTGVKLIALPELNANISKDKTGYIFNNDDENTMIRVLHSKIDAGAMGSTFFEEYAKDDKETLRIIHKTFPIPRHVVNLRGDMPAPLAKALVQTLLNMEKDENGKAVLAGFEKTTRFDDISSETHERMGQITPTVIEIFDVSEK